ncbi:MAG: hypothetical protein ACK52U_11530 [Synechococcaceae cyanobacterium]
MPGYSGYRELNGDRGYHPRHEREALVNYLLLTCIDKLGQNNQGFISLADWLQSKKVEHVSERQLILDSQAHDSPFDAKLRCLCEGYHRLYGVRNTFFAGIDSLSASGKHALLGSVHVGTVPDHGKFGPLTATQCYPLPESAQKQELQKVSL